MALSFFNTLSGMMEEFTPIDKNRVRMYCCGPTVYDFAHIGNFRTFIFEDILNRYLRYKGYDVLYVMNITDIDDKTIRNSREKGVSLSEYTEVYTNYFMEDIETLRIKKPDVFCKATEHIEDMVHLVERLSKKGFTYTIEGSTYYKVEKFKDYGKLSKKDFSGIKIGARVDADEYDKENARDFVLWKGKREGEPFWETPFGPGRPGWHLECSAMSMKYLGESFDLHCGGVDLIFPHHENEIAQSEGATGKQFVKYWLHSEYLIVNGEKMSKSKGNFYTLRDLIKRGYSPLAIRYLLLSVNYKKQLNFTDEGLHQAKSSIDRIGDFLVLLTRKDYPQGRSDRVRDRILEAKSSFEEAMDDNLNTSKALGVLFDFIRDINKMINEGGVLKGDVDEILGFLKSINEVFDIIDFPENSLESEIESLIKEREEARKRRDFKKADEIRDKLKSMGIVLMDTKDGTIWKREK